MTSEIIVHQAGPFVLMVVARPLTNDLAVLEPLDVDRLVAMFEPAARAARAYVGPTPDRAALESLAEELRCAGESRR